LFQIAVSQVTFKSPTLTMFSWINKDDQRKHEPQVYASVAEGLRKLYQQVCFTQLCFILYQGISRQIARLKHVLAPFTTDESLG